MLNIHLEFSVIFVLKDYWSSITHDIVKFECYICNYKNRTLPNYLQKKIYCNSMYSNDLSTTPALSLIYWFINLSIIYHSCYSTAHSLYNFCIVFFHHISNNSCWICNIATLVLIWLKHFHKERRNGFLLHYDSIKF